jgi:hypothetical protein
MMRLSEGRLLTAFEELDAWLFRERAVGLVESLAAKRMKQERGEPSPHLPTDPDHFVGLDLGLKRTSGVWTARPCVGVFVRRKLPMSELPSEVHVPPEVRGVPTDVIAVGNIRAPLPVDPPLILTVTKEEVRELRRLLIREERFDRLMRLRSQLTPFLLRVALDTANLNGAAKTNLTVCSRQRTHYLRRPVPGGVSIGHYQVTAGTLGCLVRDGNERLFILSNNHVLANSNNAKAGDPILQPGPYDRGKNTGRFRIGALTTFVPIHFGERNPPNRVDAAIAETEEKAVQAAICSVGKVAGVVRARRGLLVQKHGRTTGRTFGTIVGTHAKLWVDYDGQLALFTEQLRIEGGRMPFSAGGDSGSLIVDTKGRAVGLLFAGSDIENITFANPIRTVLQALKVSFVSGK